MEAHALPPRVQKIVDMQHWSVLSHSAQYVVEIQKLVQIACYTYMQIGLVWNLNRTSRTAEIGRANYIHQILALVAS